MHPDKKALTGEYRDPNKKHPEIEFWNDIALIKNDRCFNTWVRAEGRLDHHLGFLEYLRPHLGGVTVDVGANIGTHAIYYAQFGHVHCFEPLPIAFECLTHNMRNEDCTLYNLAVGDGEGTIKLISPEDDNPGATYGIPGEDIPVIAIDSLDLDDCDFIKLDCEGMEIQALRGAKETIKKFKPVLCIESNPRTLARWGATPNDLLICLYAMGYITKTKVPNDRCVDLIAEPASKHL